MLVAVPYLYRSHIKELKLVTLDVSVAKRSAPAPLRFIFALGIASQAVTMRSAIVNSSILSSLWKFEWQVRGAILGCINHFENITKLLRDALLDRPEG